MDLTKEFEGKETSSFARFASGGLAGQEGNHPEGLVESHLNAAGVSVLPAANTLGAKPTLG